jgi:hypothetical protein
LNDESKRRDYDLIYPSLRRRWSSPQNAQTPHSPPTSTPQSAALRDAAQIAAILKSKQERSERWQTKRNAFDSSIFELQRVLRRLEQDIENLKSILAAEVAAEAQKNSWATWLLSPIYKKVSESEEEKARKDRERQERRIERDMKERRLESKKTELKTEEDRLRKAKEEVDAADLSDDRKLRAIQAEIRARENRERQERERVERERMEKIWRQQQEQREKQQREAAEAMRKQQAAKRAAEQNRQQQEETRSRREQHPHFDFDFTGGTTRQARTSNCRHDGWWPKVEGRAACPECYQSWTYLLQCPGCKIKACPKCQAAIRPRTPRNTTRTSRRAPPRVRTPSPDFSYYDYY